MTRRRRAAGALAALALCTTAACGSALDRDPSGHEALLVSTEAGSVLGQSTDGVRHWWGIPYAAPPIGELRWRPPEPPAPWTGTRPAEEFGAPCLQEGQDLAPLPDSAEDCLFLNVQRPDDDREGLPVMFWIHGGGLKSGSGNLSVELTRGLVDQGIVLVSVNYRLGRLGYFAHPALEAEAEAEGREAVANFGLLDQVAALEWVRDNVEHFGGDPDQVTVFGLSAGGASVNYLMSSPRADGLFDRAVSQSGLGREVPMEWDAALAQGESLAASVGAPAADADDLRSLDADALAMLPALLLRNEVPITDPVLPSSVSETFARGEEADVPYVVGATDLELIPQFFASLGYDADTLRNELILGRRDEALAAYDGSTQELRRHFVNDVIFGEAARNLARAHADDAPTYRYRFSITSPEERARHGGALHGADYPFVFGYGAGAPQVAGAEALAAEVVECWARFAQGEPLGCSGVEWPQALDGALMHFTNDGPKALAQDPWADRLDLVESLDLGPT